MDHHLTANEYRAWTRFIAGILVVFNKFQVGLDLEYGLMHFHPAHLSWFLSDRIKTQMHIPDCTQ